MVESEVPQEPETIVVPEVVECEAPQETIVPDRQGRIQSSQGSEDHCP